MNFDLVRKANDLSLIEKSIIGSSKSVFAGTYDHWTLLDTINHACSWKRAALNKVELRVDGKEVFYHIDKPIDEINTGYYEKTKEYSIDETSAIIEEISKKTEITCAGIKGRESLKELAPIGFGGSVYEYLAYDLIYHPINHYVFYSIRNNEYEVFIELGRYIAKNRDSLFADAGKINLEGYMNENEYKVVFDKGYEWEHDELYCSIKTIVISRNEPCTKQALF